MGHFARIGLVGNPVAGRGGRDVGLAIAAAVAALAPAEVYTGAEVRAAAAWDAESGPAVHVVATPTPAGPGATRELATALAGLGLDTVVVVGGDGTLADVAGEFVTAGCSTPLLGVGAGSANAGALITCLAAECAGLGAAELVARPVDALVARVERHRVVAFNDVTVGTAIVGTGEDGSLATLSATGFLDGIRAATRPEPVAAPTAEVALEHPGGSVLLARGREVGEVVVGVLDGRFVAKASAGGACLADLSGAPAACCVSEVPLVRGPLTGAERHRPVRSVSVPVFGDSTVTVRRVSPAAVLCADGNPLARLSPGLTVTVGVRTGAVTGIGLRGRRRQAVAR